MEICPGALVRPAVQMSSRLQHTYWLPKNATQRYRWGDLEPMADSPSSPYFRGVAYKAVMLLVHIEFDWLEYSQF